MWRGGRGGRGGGGGGGGLEPLPDSFILQPPIFYPVVPYATTIFGGLHAGKMVVVQGRVPQDAQRFQIDFQCGCSLQPRPDIAIHFNPRFYTMKPHVICNSLQGGRWQREARWPGLSLGRGDAFLILFLFGAEEVRVSVNGRHFLHYPYRLPLSRVDTLGIYGHIFVEAVGFLNSNPFADGGSEYPAGSPLLLKSSRLAVPCVWPLPRGLWPGQVIVVRGLVGANPQEFTLSLQDGSSQAHMKLEVCFRSRTVAWISPWSRRERISTPFLFHPQRFFEVLLMCRDNGLQLALNGNAVGAVSLRWRALERLRELRISGNVELYCVRC
ncbi:galectin-12 isoform X3 [Monodelphis domestica]|uniref:galectin-12 isoform X3 n=1 Tax=Monodelphis domestica TaxID=13616 RepID=UPI0024E25F47|nr:galectin-12 isoform X3 [Monodelphis domestica]